ncbi:MAG: hypothetical protein P4M15_07845 [Alphaproteobacteria bacterium]|nr:hypothetical protein [Alphaproteobacteria bacterium]
MTRLLPFAVFASIVLCFALHPHSPIYTHHLADPDDYMRLDEVVAWLQGQSWHDLSVPRLSPGAHTIVHWSRLIDLPIALLAFPFTPLFGVANAAMVASFVVPLLWLALLLMLLPALARPLAGDYAPFACVFFMFAPLLLFNYTPGRVDHHGAQAIIAGFGLLALIQILRHGRASLFAVLAALTFSCGFWIGAESLPWAILFIACLALAAAYDAAIARTAALFGLCLPLFTALLIPIALPASEFSSRALSWFSPAYLIFAGLSGLIFLLGYTATRNLAARAPRIFIYAALGLAAAAAFFFLIPAALHGPFADYDAFNATDALDNIVEAQPLILSLHLNRFMPATWPQPALLILRLLALPLAALVFCLASARRERGNLRALYLCHAAFLAAATALAWFWQMRVGVFMELFTLAPLTALFAAALRRLAWQFWDRRLFWAEIAAFCLLGPLPALIIPASFAHTPLTPDLLLFPAARGKPACDLSAVAAQLNSIPGAPTIMNPSDTGPELLFATRASVIAGNFDVPGNADAFTFFNAKNDAPAREIAHKWNAGLVLVCKTAPSLYLGKDYFTLSHVALKPGEDGKLHLTNTDPRQPLIERLIRGEIPAWLKPIEIPDGSDYLLFSIEKGTKNKHPIESRTQENRNEME